MLAEGGSDPLFLIKPRENGSQVFCLSANPIRQIMLRIKDPINDRLAAMVSFERFCPSRRKLFDKGNGSRGGKTERKRTSEAAVTVTVSSRECSSHSSDPEAIATATAMTGEDTSRSIEQDDAAATATRVEALERKKASAGHGISVEKEVEKKREYLVAHEVIKILAQRFLNFEWKPTLDACIVDEHA